MLRSLALWRGVKLRPLRILLPPMRGVLFASVAIVPVAETFILASVHRFEPHSRASPVAAVVALKKLNLARVFNDYDFGGYLIANGVAPFIDGRTELFAEPVIGRAFARPFVSQ